jgi:hypothetical protein
MVYLISGNSKPRVQKLPTYICDHITASIAYTAFGYGRLVGEAAEIEDHTSRGRNMDTRTAASEFCTVQI